LLVLAPDDEAHILTLFERIVTFENESLVLSLHKRKTSGKTGEHGPHAASDDQRQSVAEQDLLLVERRVLRDREDHARGVPFLQFAGDVADEKLSAQKRETIFASKSVKCASRCVN